MAWVLGRRDAATARRLWQALPPRYHRYCWYFPDLWEAYVSVLLRWHHRRCPKGSGGTSIVEAINCSPYASAAAYWCENPAPSVSR